MKKYTYLIIVYCLWTFNGMAVAQQPLFDEANSLLSEGNYQQAIERYQRISENGYESGGLWQNLGVAYTRLDSLGKAKYYFLKAKKFSETEDRAENALEFINNQFPRESAVLPALPWIRFINFFSENVGLWVITFLALFFLYVGIATKIGSWFRLDFKKALNYVSYGSFTLAVFLFICSIVIQYQSSRYLTGVMVDREAPVYQRPEENSTIVSTAYEGYTMQVDKTESGDMQNWNYVRLENGMYGWIENEHIMTF